MMKRSVIIGNEYQTGILLDKENLTRKEWDKETVPLQPNGIYNLHVGLCNGLRVVGDVDGFNEEKLDEIFDNDAEMVMVDLFRCQPETVEMLFRKAKELPFGKLWLTPFGERDGSFWHWIEYKNDYFSTRAEAAGFFKNWLCHLTNTWKDPNRFSKNKYVKDSASKLLPLSNVANHIDMEYFPDWVPIAAHSSAAYVIHHYYEWGFKMVWVENAAWFPNLQLHLGFLRGAARQYDGWFGIDFSAWGGLTDNHMPICYDDQRRTVGGATDDFLQKGWLLGYLNGSDFVFQEVTEHAYFLSRKSVDEEPVLSPCGEKARDFADFALNRHPSQGELYTPMAVMLELNHGWDAPRFGIQNFVWGGKVPYENGDRMIENFFECAYPGYKLAPGSYEPDWNPEVPWKTAEQYTEMVRDGVDMRPYDKGKLVANRWGDGIDVVNENADLEKLKRYSVLMLLGRLVVNKKLLKTLKAYVENGGNLILNSSNIGLALDIAGVKQIGNGQQFGEVIWGDGIVDTEARFNYTCYQPVDADVLASDTKGNPLIFKNSIGQGNVYLISAKLAQTEFSQGLLNSTVRLIDNVLEPYCLVKVDGVPLQTVVNKLDNEIWVSLFNHSSESWSGKITVIPPDGMTLASVNDIWNQEAIKQFQEGVNGQLVINIEIPAFEFKILQLKDA